MQMFNERIRGGAPQSVTVTGTSAVVLPVNSERRYAIFTNDGGVPIYLALHDTAEVNKGVRLNANGGSYEINYTNYYTGVVSAVCSTSANLCYIEG